MTEARLPCVRLDPPGPHDATVIWLHGLGADGNDFVPAVPYLGLGDDHGVRFVFPTAPAIPVTINAGMVMPAWYDIRDLDLQAPGRSDAEGLVRSVDRVRALVEDEVSSGTPSERVVVAGFSQGGAVAVDLALTHPVPLGGLVLLSTYVVTPERIEAQRTEANAGLGVFQAHGVLDPMVPVAAGRGGRDLLQRLGHEVAWQEYPIGHEVSLPELQSLGRHLARWLAP